MNKVGEGNGQAGLLRILTYGDSNTWGYADDASGRRYSPEARWPCVMAAALREGSDTDLEVIEEGLPGRTTAFPDPKMQAYMDGSLTFGPLLFSHAPLDGVVVMLGTNDVKQHLNLDPSQIADGLSRLIYILQNTPCGHGPWGEGVIPRLMIVCPPRLGAIADDRTWDVDEMWVGGRSKTEALPARYRVIAAEAGAIFFDANEFISASPLDPIHLSEQAQQQLGTSIAARLRLEWWR